MAYSGKYNPNPAKYRGDVTKVTYRSLWELHCFKWCDDNPSVKYWSSEEVVVPYFWDIDKKMHRYYVDLKITFTEGKVILVEIKPDKQTKPPTTRKRTKRHISESLEYVRNQCKWKAASEYCKDNGYEFQIWTENELKKMGMKF